MAMLCPVWPSSIVAGQSLSGTLGQPPFANLLVDALRVGADGVLALDFHPEPRNRIVFRSGLPVLVQLPDLGPTMVSLLVKDGTCGRDQGLALVRATDMAGTSESRLIERKQILSGGALRHARGRRAHAQLARLVDTLDVGFSFTPSLETVDPSAATLVEPLAALHEGLAHSPGARAAQPHLPPTDAELALAATYPLGADPFGLGLERERALSRPFSMQRLMATGWTAESAAATLAALALADMVEVQPRAVPHAVEVLSAPPRRSSRPASSGWPVPGPSVSSSPAAEPGGLQVHRRSVRPLVEPTPSHSPPPEMVLSSDLEPPASLVPMGDKLGPFEGKTYFQILRVGRDTDFTQLERAYRFLVRRAKEASDPESTHALTGMFREAYVYLRDPQRRARYSAALTRDRHALEAEPKLERAVRVLGEGYDQEALYLAEWACRLAPHRSELEAVVTAVVWLSTPPPSREENPRARVAAEAERSQDRRLKLLSAALHAQSGDMGSAKRVLSDVVELDHPVVARFVMSRPS